MKIHIGSKIKSHINKNPIELHMTSDIIQAYKDVYNYPEGSPELDKKILELNAASKSGSIKIQRIDKSDDYNVIMELEEVSELKAETEELKEAIEKINDIQQ